MPWNAFPFHSMHMHPNTWALTHTPSSSNLHQLSRKEGLEERGGLRWEERGWKLRRERVELEEWEGGIGGEREYIVWLICSIFYYEWHCYAWVYIYYRRVEWLHAVLDKMYSLVGIVCPRAPRTPHPPGFLWKGYSWNWERYMYMTILTCGVKCGDTVCCHSSGLRAFDYY